MFSHWGMCAENSSKHNLQLGPAKFSATLILMPYLFVGGEDTTSMVLVRGAQRSFDPRGALSPKVVPNTVFPLKLPEVFGARLGGGGWPPWSPCGMERVISFWLSFSGATQPGAGEAGLRRGGDSERAWHPDSAPWPKQGDLRLSVWRHTQWPPSLRVFKLFKAFSRR